MKTKLTKLLILSALFWSCSNTTNDENKTEIVEETVVGVEQATESGLKYTDEVIGIKSEIKDGALNFWQDK